MDEVNITSAQYKENQFGEVYCIKAVFDGTSLNVPIAAGNTHYDEIMRQVNAGTLTIQDAD